MLGFSVIHCISDHSRSLKQNCILTCLLFFNVPLLCSPVKQLIDSKYFFCMRSVRFIPLDKACDGKDDCTGGEDEITCVSSFTVNTTFPGKTKTWLCLTLSVSTQTQKQKLDKWLLFSFPRHNSPLQCVWCQVRVSCRCTVPAQDGGVCVVTTGLRSTHRQHVNN